MAGRSAPVLVVLLALAAAGSVLTHAEAAGAACETGPVPTTVYVGTVVGRYADAPDQYHFRLDDGRVILLEVAPRDREDGFGGPVPKVGHRYRVQGGGTKAPDFEEIGLSGCVPSALVDLGVPPGSPSSQTGSRAGTAAAVALALLGAVALLIAHRRGLRERAR